MWRKTWLAPAFALALAAVPVLARLCEIHCEARASHCHEAAPAQGGGCPERAHRSETPSVAAGKIVAAVSDAAALAVFAPAVLAAPSSRCLGHVSPGAFRAGTAPVASSVLRL